MLERSAVRRSRIQNSGKNCRQRASVSWKKVLPWQSNKVFPMGRELKGEFRNWTRHIWVTVRMIIPIRVYLSWKTGLKKVCASWRSHSSCWRQRPGHHCKLRKNGFPSSNRAMASQNRLRLGLSSSCSRDKLASSLTALCMCPKEQ